MCRLMWHHKTILVSEVSENRNATSQHLSVVLPLWQDIKAVYAQEGRDGNLKKKDLKKNTH